MGVALLVGAVTFLVTQSIGDAICFGIIAGVLLG